jgi:hypothetical protein
VGNAATAAVGNAPPIGVAEGVFAVVRVTGELG